MGANMEAPGSARGALRGAIIHHSLIRTLRLAAATTTTPIVRVIESKKLLLIVAIC